MSRLNPELAIPDHERDPRDVEAENNSDHAYSKGGWLEFCDGTNQAGVVRSRKELFGDHFVDPASDDRRKFDRQVLLGGEYIDEALGQLGLDGATLYAPAPTFTTDTGLLGDYERLDRLFAGTKTTEDDLNAELKGLNAAYTSPTVRDPRRLISKVPVEVPKDPDNILWQYFGSAETVKLFTGGLTSRLDDVGNTTVEASFFEPVTLKHKLQSNTRLIIDEIPTGEIDALDQDAPLMQVHIYRNSEGYLVAEKVLEAQIIKKESIPASVDEGRINIQESVSPRLGGGDIYPYNDRKLYLRDKRTGEVKGLRLLTTTARWSHDDVGYTTMEISIRTPDDSGDEIQVGFTGGDGRHRPIVFRVVPDNEDTALPVDS